MEARTTGSSAGCDPWMPQKLDDLLPDLSIEERARFMRPSGGRQRIRLRHPDVPLPPVRGAGLKESFMIPRVGDALHYYNARNPGDEFDAVKPLAEGSIHFRGQLWWHLNFWARSRRSNQIKRFFAEVHYDPATRACLCPNQPFVPPIPVVEVCTIIEEPLSRYRTSCNFCCSHLNILHPMDDQSFVCGKNGDLQGPSQCKLTFGKAGVGTPGFGMPPGFDMPWMPPGLGMTRTLGKSTCCPQPDHSQY